MGVKKQNCRGGEGRAQKTQKTPPFGLGRQGLSEKRMYVHLHARLLTHAPTPTEQLHSQCPCLRRGTGWQGTGPVHFLNFEPWKCTPYSKNN